MHHKFLTIGLLTQALLSAPAARAAAPDGGPGGACLDDADCDICGWVCSLPRGNICVPGREGDPGQCHDGGRGCACAGQTCVAEACAPAPNPACWCNGDCPSGQSCDQLLLTCHPPSTLFCGKSYDGYDDGPQSTGPACGCNGICAAGDDAGTFTCAAQASFNPSTCASDIDCGACYQGSRCVEGTCTPFGNAGWCTDSRDLAPVFPMATKSDAGASQSAKSSGCGARGPLSPAIVALLGLMVLQRARRRRDC